MDLSKEEFDLWYNNAKITTDMLYLQFSILSSIPDLKYVSKYTPVLIGQIPEIKDILYILEQSKKYVEVLKQVYYEQDKFKQDMAPISIYLFDAQWNNNKIDKKFLEASLENPDIKFLTIDVNGEPEELELTNKYNIKNVPTVCYLINNILSMAVTGTSQNIKDIILNIRQNLKDPNYLSNYLDIKLQ